MFCFCFFSREASGIDLSGVVAHEQRLRGRREEGVIFCADGLGGCFLWCALYDTAVFSTSRRGVVASKTEDEKSGTVGLEKETI